MLRSDGIQEGTGHAPIPPGDGESGAVAQEGAKSIQGGGTGLEKTGRGDRPQRVPEEEETSSEETDRKKNPSTERLKGENGRGGEI